jgi:purine-binding chemotaxis protein CheW
VPEEDAQVPAEQTAALGVEQVVLFDLGDQRYALPIGQVQEIQQLVEPTSVPDTRSALLGMVNLRGTVVPALDLRGLLGLEMRGYDLQTPMIICRVGERLAAIVVDEVEDVIDVPLESMQSPSKIYDLADKMVGVCQLESGLVFVLDVERLLPESELAEVEGLMGVPE